MRYAMRNGSDKAEPEPGLYAVCHGCREDVFAKCGAVLGWHWCHYPGSTCAEAVTEPETVWHKGWKGCVDARYREVTVRKDGRVKRADIKARTNTVIELQHSPITSGVVVDREEFYGRNMLWIFDSDGRSRKICNSSLGGPGTWNSLKMWEVSMGEQVVGIGTTGRPSLVDLGSYVARVVPHVTNHPRRFQCVIFPAEQVRSAVAHTCDEVDPNVAFFLLDTVTDWMRVKATGRRKSPTKGFSTQDYCPRVGDLFRYHLDWLATRTERTSTDYYLEGH